MMRKTLGMAGILFFGLCMSCSDNATSPDTEVIVGSGNLIVRERSIAGFHSVDLNSPGKVNLFSGAEQRVVITVNDNLMDYITTEVSGGKLVIDTKPGVQISNLNLTVDLTMTDLEVLTINGAGLFTGKSKFIVDTASLIINGAGSFILDIEADSLNSTINGAGNLMLSGKAGSHKVDVLGVGPLKAFGLLTITTTVIIKGAGNAEVSASLVLNVTIEGAGSVYYKGNPTINSTISGSGKIVDSNDS